MFSLKIKIFLLGNFQVIAKLFLVMVDLVSKAIFGSFLQIGFFFVLTF
jgi:hypothetical protein